MRGLQVGPHEAEISATSSGDERRPHVRLDFYSAPAELLGTLPMERFGSNRFKAMIC